MDDQKGRKKITDRKRSGGISLKAVSWFFWKEKAILAIFDVKGPWSEIHDNGLDSFGSEYDPVSACYEYSNNTSGSVKDIKYST
jgi:hypothetical protein